MLVPRSTYDQVCAERDRALADRDSFRDQLLAVQAELVEIAKAKAGLSVGEGAKSEPMPREVRAMIDQMCVGMASASKRRVLENANAQFKREGNWDGVRAELEALRPAVDATGSV